MTTDRYYKASSFNWKMLSAELKYSKNAGIRECIPGKVWDQG